VSLNVHVPSILKVGPLVYLAPKTF
jgi:hypothetical protein